MSSSMALRRSPKPRGLDGSALQRAAELVHHQGGQRFAFDVLSDDQEGLPILAVCSSSGSRSFNRADFLFVDEDADVLEDALHALGSVMK